MKETGKLFQNVLYKMLKKQAKNYPEVETWGRIIFQPLVYCSQFSVPHLLLRGVKEWWGHP